MNQTSQSHPLEIGLKGIGILVVLNWMFTLGNLETKNLFVYVAAIAPFSAATIITVLSAKEYFEGTSQNAFAAAGFLAIVFGIGALITHLFLPSLIFDFEKIFKVGERHYFPVKIGYWLLELFCQYFSRVNPLNILGSVLIGFFASEKIEQR